MCGTDISEDPFSIRHVPDQYKTLPICDEVVDDCLTDKIKLDYDKNFYEKDPDTITHVKNLALRGKSIKHKTLKFIKHKDK